MHPDQEALLATIAADPGDDLPRLVYADWLDEYARTPADAARAAFIRRQVAEWRSPEPWELFDAPRPSLALLERYRDDWLAGVPKKQRPWVLFERGFPDALRPVKVRTGFLPLFTRPELATVRRLVIPAGNGMRPGDYGKIAASPGLARVEEVRLGDFLGARAVVALLGGPHLGRLESLVCEGGVVDVWAVLAAPAPPALRRVRLAVGGLSAPRAGGEVSPADVEESPLLRGLADLTLSAWHADDVNRAVCRGAGPAGLVRLALGAVNPPAVRDFGLPRLRRLTLRLPPVTFVGDPVTAALAANPRLAGLEALSLVNAPVPLAAFARLAESPALPGLKRLDVEVSGDQAILTDYLLAADAPLRFEKLCVGRAFFTAARAARLRARYGPRLQLRTDAELEPTLRRLGQW